MNRARVIRLRQWLAALAILAGCGKTTSLGGFGDTGDGGNTADGGSTLPTGDGSTGFGTSSGGGVLPTGPVNDFAAPVFDTGAPMNAASLFSGTQGATSGGPCLVEPEANVLYPQNWLNPRFRWTPAGNENLFELRIHVANQMTDLVVYTPNSVWEMPTPLWDDLRTHSATEAMTITLQGGTLSGSSLQNVAMGTQTPMGVAPVQATGAIVYWALDKANNLSVLKGFSPGDSTVEPVLTPMQYSQGQSVTSVCIGCHASTPDGEFAGFTSTANNGNEVWNGGIALLDQADAGTIGAAPSFMGAAGATALQNWNTGGMAFSAGHWAAGDRRAVVMFDNNAVSSVTEAPTSELTWIDLEATTMATASGTIARTGDSRLAAAPSWTHDGNTIAYVSTNRVCTGRLGNCVPNQYNQPPDPGSQAAIYTVPYAGGAGGTATPLSGASDPSQQNYYPAYSPDDGLIAFNRVALDLNLYYQPAAELFVIPASGGTATRLAANDPPQCTGLKSPGLNNVWPKWGPAAPSANGLTFYWMIFSSERYDRATEQLYMTAVVKMGDGTLQTYGAIYLWNQPSTEDNKTPAWDKFKVPPLPSVQ